MNRFSVLFFNATFHIAGDPLNNFHHHDGVRSTFVSRALTSCHGNLRFALLNSESVKLSAKIFRRFSAAPLVGENCSAIAVTAAVTIYPYRGISVLFYWYQNDTFA